MCINSLIKFFGARRFVLAWTYVRRGVQASYGRFASFSTVTKRRRGANCGCGANHVAARSAETSLLKEYMRRYQDGDAEAAAHLMRRLNPKLARYFHASEPLLAECWRRIEGARQTYRQGEPVLPWVFAIARTVVDRKCGSAMVDVVDRLPSAQREVIVLLKVVGLTVEEVAAATGATVNAVRGKASRAYRTIRKALGPGRK